MVGEFLSGQPFDAARAGFEDALAGFPSNQTEAEFQVWMMRGTGRPKNAPCGNARNCCRRGTSLFPIVPISHSRSNQIPAARSSREDDRANSVMLPPEVEKLGIRQAAGRTMERSSLSIDGAIPG
jgi:hypothetical protein